MEVDLNKIFNVSERYIENLSPLEQAVWWMQHRIFGSELTISHWTDEEVAPEFGRGDGSGYEILQQAAEYSLGARGISVEIGVREGCGSKIMIEEFKKSEFPKLHIGIDPYGSIPYLYKDTEHVLNAYPNEMRDVAIPELYKLCAGSNVDFMFFQMTDEQFFKRFADGIPIYMNNTEYIINEYGCVYFDGPHTTKTTLNETKFFAPRASLNAMFIYDDVEEYYDHDVIESYLLDEDGTWAQIIRTNVKAVYHKIKVK